MKKICVAAFLALFILAGAAWGQVSLWAAPETPKNGNGSVQPQANGQKVEAKSSLLREVKSRDFRLHDIISVIVELVAEASTDEQADTEKKTNKLQFEINQYLKLHKSDASAFGVDLKGVSPSNLGVDMTSDKKFQGDGQADRADTLNARLAAEIVDIKPNGNLVIEARHTVTKQREKTTITVSGVVRPQDVGPDNTVLSFNVADADIRYESSGPITDANRRGWLSRLLDKLWPF